jgi:RNA polymerase-binding transcription factor DksA
MNEMESNYEWTSEGALTIIRNSSEWYRFVRWNETRILERLARYNNRETVKEQLKDLRGLSDYQHYKINTVSRYLQQALAKINDGSYGVCTQCECEISTGRLFHVPGALMCVECDNKVNR